MEKMSEKDIDDVTQTTRLLFPDLNNLFVKLGLQKHEIEKAKKNADTTDVKLQAASVLHSWRNIRGSDATRQAIITALKSRRYIEAVEILQEKWGMTTKGISNSEFIMLAHVTVQNVGRIYTC